MIRVHDPHLLRQFLFDDVAKQAPLLQFKVSLARSELIAHPPGDEGRGRNLRVGMTQVLPRERPLVAKDGHIAEAPIFLQVRGPGRISLQDQGDVVVALLGKRQPVVGMFHHNLVGSEVVHLVVDAFRPPLGIALNAVEWP